MVEAFASERSNKRQKQGIKRKVKKKQGSADEFTA